MKSNEEPPVKDLPERLRIKASMIEFGDRIAWGSDSALMREAMRKVMSDSYIQGSNDCHKAMMRDWK